MDLIFHIAGILLIMGSTVWTGATLAAREKYRLRDLGELERGVLLLEGQIAYLSAPLIRRRCWKVWAGKWRVPQA